MVFAIGDPSRNETTKPPTVSRQNLSDQVPVTLRFVAIHNIPQQADTVVTRDGASAGFRTFTYEHAGSPPGPRAEYFRPPPLALPLTARHGIHIPRGSRPTQGWLIDAYPDYERDTIVLWLWNKDAAHRIEDKAFEASFFIRPPPREIPEVRRRLQTLHPVEDVREVERRGDIGREDTPPGLQGAPRPYRELPDIAKIVDSNGGDHHHTPAQHGPPGA